MNDSSTTRLYLVRHGEVVANVERRFIGTGDQRLTERGRQQAARLAEALRELDVAAVYTSPLARALETASPIAAALGLEPVVDERLAEQDFGAWEGLTREEIDGEGGAGSWWRSAGGAPPGGEASESVRDRVLDLAFDLALRHAGASVVVVSHVGPIKAALSAVLGLDAAVPLPIILDPATISVVDWGRPPVIRLCNAHAHLGWLAARWMGPAND